MLGQSLALGLTLAALLAGCGGDDSSDGGSTDATVRPDGAPITCSNGTQDELETDVDCGGGICPRCADDSMCAIGGDCISLYCRGSCQELPSCANGMQDGLETDVDCGGPHCNPCAVDSSCMDAFDCESILCVSGTCRAVPPACMDGAMGGTESDVDCGGAECPACVDGSACGGDADCRSSMCGGEGCCSNTAGLSWDAPDSNEDGTCANDLAGFRAKWGLEAGVYTDMHDIPLDDAGLSCAYTGGAGPCAPVIRCFYRVVGLPAGLVHFAVTAYDTAGNESAPSVEATKMVYPCP